MDQERSQIHNSQHSPGAQGRRPILEAGRNCWRLEHADRAAWLVDGDAYFKAFRDAVIKAQRSILIIGWDIDSRVTLLRGGETDGWPLKLGDFLNEVVRRRPDLHIHVLIWDFAMIYAAEREWLPVYHLGWKTHRRLHFRMDARHPVGSSHHQKIVVVDDRIAFSGGFDLSKRRWDTSAHDAAESRRIDPDGLPYAPFHDVQMLVDGDAATALGELARDRWYRATGEHIPPLQGTSGDPWPCCVEPDVRNVNVAVARSVPAYRGQVEVREVERLYVDSIAAARRLIYIENQFFTSHRIRDALAERLQQPKGPEVVLVLPQKSGDWLEQHTMDVLRGRVLRHLQEADAHGRLAIYYPYRQALADDYIRVHAKITIVDDDFVRIASSNLSNRSMGLDTECDLAIETGDDPAVQAAIAGLRSRLLAEHLCTGLERVEAAQRSPQRSLIAAIETLDGGGCALRPLEVDIPRELDEQVPDAALLDPERPVNGDLIVERMLEPEERRPLRRRLALWLSILLALLALAAAWRWTPLGEWLDLHAVVTHAEALRGSWLALPMVIAVYTLAGLFAFPVTVLIVMTGMIFGTAYGFAYALLGAEASALATYAIGHYLGRDAIRQLAGANINRVSRRLGRKGLLTIITVRIVPFAPFTVVNLVAGASHIRLRDYALGSLLGMAPGILGLTFFSHQFARAIRDPHPFPFVILATLAAIVVLAGWALIRWLARRQGEEGQQG